MRSVHRALAVHGAHGTRFNTALAMPLAALQWRPPQSAAAVDSGSWGVEAEVAAVPATWGDVASAAQLFELVFSAGVWRAVKALPWWWWLLEVLWLAVVAASWQLTLVHLPVQP